MENDRTLEDISSKIQLEQKVLRAAQSMRPQLRDRQAIAQCENEIRESEKRISFLENEYRRIHNRMTHSGGSIKSGGRDDTPEFSKLDLRKSETPITTQKISLKLHEIAYKLHVEKKLKEGTNRLSTIYGSDPHIGGRRDRAQLNAKMSETAEKIKLLTRSLHKYQGLYIGKSNESLTDFDTTHQDSPIHKRPVTGKLTITIHAGKDLAHAPLRNMRQFESIAVIKIDGNERERTRPSPNVRWNETFEIEVSKASELEIELYDRPIDRHIPIGSIWIKFAEILEDMRKQQQMQDTQSGWASAGQIQANQVATADQISSHPPSASFSPRAIESWWDVEPSGQIHLSLNFVKTNVNKRTISRLGRQGAVRKPKENVVEMNGHKFSPKAFYQVMKCAHCGDFVVNTTALQCQECDYFCHRKCCDKVVAKCISQADSEMAEEQIKHRIPHRFESVTNFAANWCCHCGYLLPLGRKDVRKCAECGIFCHERCLHLVPNFCGMSMAMAAQILAQIKLSKRKAIERVTSPHKPSKPTSDQSYSPLKSAFSKSESPQKFLEGKKVSINDFHFLSVLGKGNFGKVMLSEEKSTGNLYAIKVLKKAFIIQNDEVESTKSEKRVFLAANHERHPFLVGLHSCFQTESRIYFVMEYVSGGDLMLHIQRQQFSERQARFYACEVLLALEYFHKNDIIYRDLKLDNILLTLDGHIKIADYGLCKENMYYGATTNTFCGTPEFMAPEILLEQRYGRAVDWWAFGVLIYEMLLGQSPFRGDDEDEIFDAILEDEVLYPINMSRDSVSILQRLLTREPTKRLGAGPTDAEEVKRHPFFRSVDWQAIFEKKVPPPFIPSINSRTDTSNFDEEFTREPPVLTPTNTFLNTEEQRQFHVL